jgi:enoyl-CoA hydratase/carnithine racemase
MTAFPAYETIATEMVGTHVLKVTLNRPQVGNAINTQSGHDLLDLWNRLTADAGDIRCIVLQHELFERMYWTLVDLPIPVIAAVNGHAYAGGLEMALSCDFIYASNAARFALTEVTLGIMPGAGGTQNLPRAIGERRAKEILMTGKPFSAQQASEYGLINAILEPTEVLAKALETAEVIASNAPLSVRQIKKSVRYGGQMELRTAFRFEIEAYNHLIDTEDRMEGVKAFNEKRKANFKGC